MNELHRGSIVAGVIFVLLGVAFLLDRLEVWTIRARFLWPVLLIALGVTIIARGRGRHA